MTLLLPLLLILRLWPHAPLATRVPLSTAIYSAAIWAFSLQQILNRAYYALHDTMTPLIWGIVNLASELINQDDEVVQKGEHKLMILRRPDAQQEDPS